MAHLGYCGGTINFVFQKERGIDPKHKDHCILLWSASGGYLMQEPPFDMLEIAVEDKDLFLTWLDIWPEDLMVNQYDT